MFFNIYKKNLHTYYLYDAKYVGKIKIILSTGGLQPDFYTTSCIINCLYLSLLLQTQQSCIRQSFLYSYLSLVKGKEHVYGRLSEKLFPYRPTFVVIIVKLVLVKCKATICTRINTYLKFGPRFLGSVTHFRTYRYYTSGTDKYWNGAEQCCNFNITASI